MMFIISCHRTNSYEISILKKWTFNGIILKVYEDQSNHYMWTFDVCDHDSIFSVGASYYPKSWEFGKVGDSITKRKGCLFIKITKPKGESKVFNYKD